MDTEVVVVGAGPYGLSVAAHLRGRGVNVSTFGRPLETWRHHMPAGMLLKSDGFASSLDAPMDGWRLSDYCARQGLAYGDREPRVSLDTFVAYGLAFQQELVPDLDPRTVSRVETVRDGFGLKLEDGSTLTARRVVVAAGITHFARVPEVLRRLGPAVTHSSEHREFGQFAGRRVGVLGAGSSAVEVAAALLDAGAETTLVTRREEIPFWSAPSDRRLTLRERVRNPSSGLGRGWRQKLCQDLPDVFRHLPADRRLRIVHSFLGPVSGHWLKAKVLGGAQILTGASVLRASDEAGEVVLALQGSGTPDRLVVDHVVAATGDAADIDRLPFLDDSIRRGTTRVGAMPELSRSFESSVPGLHYVGSVAAGSFGPLMRFMVGSEFSAPRVARSVARGSSARR